MANQSQYKVCLVYISATVKTMGGSEDSFLRVPANLLALSKYVEEQKPENSNIIISTLVFSPTEKISAIAKRIELEKADLTGFSCYVWNLDRSMSVAKLLSMNFAGKILVGGPETGSAGDLMERFPFVNFCIRGDGEELMLKLIMELADGRTPRFQGLVSRLESGIDDPGGHGLIKDLNSLPRIFTKEFIDSLPDDTRIIYTSDRGCFTKCKFCACTSSFRRLRLETVEEEIKLLSMASNVSEISIADPDSSYDINRTKRIISVIEKYNTMRKPVFMFFSFMNTDTELLEMIRRNKITLLVGVQSVNNESLQIANRSLYIARDTLRNIENAIQHLDPMQISIIFINGLPGDTFETVSKSVRWAQSVGCQSMTIFNLQALPGTYFRAHAAEYGIRYKPTPFYNVKETNTFSAPEIRRTRSISFWCQILYPMFPPDILVKLARENIYLWDIACKFPFMSAEKIKKYTITPETGIVCLDQDKNRNMRRLVVSIMERISAEDPHARAILNTLPPQILKEVNATTDALSPDTMIQSAQC